MSSCPPPPRTERKEDMGFERQPMVTWFDPKQLSRTGIKVLLSSLFGSYSDKREIQAALNKSNGQLDHDYSDNHDIWLDFLADTGDGWNSTYTMAKLLAEERREYNFADKTYDTERGRVLILGGDQVYPAASRTEYKNRFLGPFRTALPWVDENKTPPHIFALPGNHDWYDGLTSFLRLFCQGQWIGGWKTQQKYSYFAIKLPHNWWLLGIDIQLDADIDKPQLDYFSRIASQYMKPGDNIILCNAAPSWINASSEEDNEYSNLTYFVRKVLIPHGGQVKVMLTGDLHHYCRYENVDDSSVHKITSGGGGAYLYPTHRMPKELNLTEPDATSNLKPVKYKLADTGTFPDNKTSRRLRYGVLGFHFNNSLFGGMLAIFYLLYAWLLRSSGMSLAQNELSFVEHIRTLNPLDVANFTTVISSYLYLLLYSPSVVVLTVLLIGGLIAFTGVATWKDSIAGAIHGVIHVALILYLTWFFSYLNSSILFPGVSVNSIPYIVLILTEMLFVGGFLGGLIMGVYLLITEVMPGLHLHTNEVFSSQKIEDYKNYLRLKIDSNGRLTIFPIGVTKVVKKWKLNAQAKDGESWFEPAKGKIDSHLIEKPINIG